MTILIAGLSTIPIYLTGSLVQDLLFWQRRPAGWERLVLGWLLGSGAVTLLVFLFSLINYQTAMKWSVWVMILAALGYGCWRLWHLVSAYKMRQITWLGRSAAVSALLVTFGSVLFALVSFAAQLGHDGLTIWGLMGKVIFLNGGRPPVEVLIRPFQWIHHLDYPLLIPTLEAWVYTFLGRVDEQAVKIIFVLFYISLLLAFFLAVNHYFSRPLSVIFTLLLASTPYLGSIAAVSGYVDVPLMSFMMAAFYFFQCWLAEEKDSDLLIGAVLASLAVWVKREGLIYWAVGFVFVIVYVLGQRNRLIKARFLSILRLTMPSILIVVPWLAYLVLNNFPNTDFVSPGVAVLWANSDRLPVIAGRLLRLWFTSIGSWGLLWILFAVTLMLTWPKLGNRPAIFTAGYTLLPPLLLSFSFVFSDWGDLFVGHMNVSIDRLWLHATPMAWYFVAIQNVGLEDWLRQLVIKSSSKIRNSHFRAQ